MVIQIVDISGVHALKSENDPPVGADRHRPEPVIAASEAVQPEAGQIHIVRGRRRIEAHRNVSHPLAVFRMDAPIVATLHEAPERPAPEASYHVQL